MDIGSILSAAFALLKADEQKVVLPLLATFFTSIAGNPTALNFAAASAQLQVSIIAAQPNIAQDVLKGIAAAINAALAPTPAPAAAK